VTLTEASRTERPLHLGALKFLSVARSHVGRVRTVNEDASLNRPDIGLWAVADGMGGHQRGDIASEELITALAGVRAFSSAYSFRDAVSTAIARTNAALFASADDDTIGSTIVTLLAYNGHFSCLWAGDSRAYLYRNGVLKRLTKDHSVVQDMIDAGVLSANDARRHPKANMITRAVGARPAVALDDVCGAILPGDRFLLCSDGLHGPVSDQSIAEIVRRAPLEWAANALIERALADGNDNITAVLIAAEER
jgi:serine/threonine protein phosphatase PrpC